MTAQLRELQELPISERILLVEDLWDSIAEDASACRLSVEQSDELNARLDALDADPRQGAHWEISKQRIVASLVSPKAFSFWYNSGLNVFTPRHLSS
jgi:putative addiction module component (TIGR02574 family)